MTTDGVPDTRASAPERESADVDGSIDLGEIRARLNGARGRDYWRSLEEIAGTPRFQEFLHREFPAQASEWVDPVGRREFLKLMGASLALAGVSACTKQPPEQIVPYVRQPEEVVPGRPLFFATAMSLGGVATGLLVESHLGRPTKIEGNPDHPASLGATDSYAQASVLGLYDPDRSQTLTYLGEIRPWSAFLGAIRGAMQAHKSRQGAGLRILTETVGSPTLGEQLQELLRTYPAAKWHQYEPANRDNARAGARLAFGQDVDAQYRIENADVIVALDADFLSCGPGHLRYTREFAARRRVTPERPAMNRLYVVESTPSNTGARADHRLPMRASEIESFARALAAELGVPGAGGAAPLRPAAHDWITALATDLRQHQGAGLLVAGDGQPPVVHALVHAMNETLGNVGRTVVYTEPVIVSPVDELQSLGELVRDIDAGQVDLLLILGGNPVLTAPADLRFADRLMKVALRVHLSLHDDETSARCQWHVPEAHYLESWSDARAYDGTVSIVQPLIAPLYGGKSAHELLAVFTDRPERTGYDIVREHWMRRLSGSAAGAAPGTTAAGVSPPQPMAPVAQPFRAAPSTLPTPVAQPPTDAPVAALPVQAPSGAPAPAFDRLWRKALHDGVVAGTALPPKAVKVRASFAASAVPPAPGSAGNRPDELEVIFRPDPTIHDGRFANNAWLQELPKPLTAITWENAVLISPATAERLHLNNEDRVTVHYRKRSVTAPVWIVPGHAVDSVTLHLGYGRTRAGRAGTGTGFDAYRLRSSDAPWFGAGLRLEPTGERHPLAVTQRHHVMEGRNHVHVASIDDYRRDPGSAFHGEHEPPKTLTLYPSYKYEGYAWGMAIDINACTGCNACVVACQAENNIPVVGKDQVARGREMHWLRVDTYHRGGVDNPETYHQPVPCMHCENAPCELVCPVAATAHSAEGLNDMVYNRCVGTRYCSNNCPYKVRRFNFLLYQDWNTPELKLVRNPDVTVRSRGVMEKCTYCVQRINEAKIDAERENRRVRDGEILTACQAVCPAEAIVFGDINDPASKVARLKAEARNYSLLGELNVRPRTTYLGALRNPNPALEPAEPGPRPHGTD